MKPFHRLCLCVCLLCGAACSEGFEVGTEDADVPDGEVRDGDVHDAGVRDAAGEDVLLNADASSPDAATLDAALTDAVAVDGSTPDTCSPPWLVTLVRRQSTGAMDLWRFSLAGGERQRCMPAQPFVLPEDARDAELVDNATAIVASLTEVVLVDVVSGETLDTFTPPEGDFTELQTIAFGSTARLGAVAWGTGEDGRLNRVERLTGHPRGGSANLDLELPEEKFCRWPMRVSSYQGDQAAASFTSCNEVFSFSPTTGNREDDLDLPQEVGGYVFHSLPDGTTAGADTVGVVLWRPGQTRRSVSNPCSSRELEAAPDPSDSNAAFLRCTDDLMHYDFESSELSTVIGEAVEDLDFNVVSLGVAPGR